MAKTPRRDDEPTRSRRVRGALAPLGRASAAATACILWVGLALPGLQLLPGSGGFGDRSIAISLQSALLGIDNGYASTPEARAAMRALGLAVISQSPVPGLQTDSPVSLAVDLAESIRADTVDTTVAPTLVSDGPHNRPSADADAPAGTAPPHGQPSEPATAERAGAACRARRSRRRLRRRARSRSRSPPRPRAPSWAAPTRSGLLRAPVSRSASRSRPAARASARSPARPSASSGPERAPSGRTRQGTRATCRRRRSRSPSTSTTRSPPRRSASSRASFRRPCPRPPVQREREGDLGAARRARRRRTRVPGSAR